MARQGGLRDRLVGAFQDRGVAGLAAAQAIDAARRENRCRFVHAFPSINDSTSNAISRKVGFTLVEECEFEYPPGSFVRCNDWRLDVFARP